MESFESTSTNKEPTEKELQELLLEAYSRMAGILRERSEEGNKNIATVSAVTQELYDKDISGLLTIESKDGEYHIKHDQTDYSLLTTEKNTTTRFRLRFNMNARKFILETTGEQPDIMDDALDTAQTEDEYGVMIQTAETYYAQQFRPASAAEIQFFAEIMEYGALGNKHIDFEMFELQVGHYIDEEEMKRSEEEERALEEDENNPE